MELPRTHPPDRVPVLDILRAVAIILVLGRHGRLFTGLDNQFIRGWERVGWVGVDLFFVLSGYLISGLLFKEYQRTATFNISRFYIRRGFKIWPTFYVMVFTIALYKSFEPIRIAIELLFLQSYLAGIQVHTWSIAVEEHFYLLLPLILKRIFRGDHFKRIGWLVALVAVCSLALRITSVSSGGPFLSVAYTKSHLRFDGLFFGVWLSYLAYFRPDWFKWLSTRRALPFVSLALLAPCVFIPIESRAMLTWGLTSVYLGFGGALLWSLQQRVPSFLLPLALIGQNSYSIYLWHTTVTIWLASSFQFGKLATFLTYFFGAFVVGMLSARCIEFPFLSLRDRLFPQFVKPRAVKVAPAGAL